MFIRSEERLEALADKKEARAQEQRSTVAPATLAAPAAPEASATPAAPNAKPEGMELVRSDQVRNLWGSCATNDLESFKTEGHADGFPARILCMHSLCRLRSELLVLRRNAKDRVELLRKAESHLPRCPSYVFRVCVAVHYPDPRC